MLPEERNKILDKMRKLAAMADPERGGFENEVAVAAAKLQAMMDQYNITLAEILNHEADGTSKPSIHFHQYTSLSIFGGLKAWHWSLARAISRIANTKYFGSVNYGPSTRDGKHILGWSMTFFGSEESIKMAGDLFDEWADTIDKMATKETSRYCSDMEDENWVKELKIYYGVKQFRHIPRLGDSHPNVWRQSWLDGVLWGIHDALGAQEKKRTVETSTALMVIGSALEISYAQLSLSFRKKNTSSRGSGYNSDAFSAGKAVGSKIKIGSKKLGD